MTKTRALCLFAAAAAAGALPLGAVTAKRVLRVDDLYAMREVAEPALSPDGAWVAYSVTTLEREEDAKQSDLSLIAARGGDALQLTRDPKTSDWLPRFSPDGKWIAFLSDRGEGKTQVWLLDRRGGEPSRLTELPGGVSDFQWSPDSGRMILVSKDPDPAAAAKPARPAPIVVNRLFFKTDGTGYLGERRKHLHLFDLASKTSLQLTSGPYDDSEPAWSPDGRRIAFVSNRTAEPDSNEDTDVFVLDARPGAQPRRVSAERFADFSPAWSPDGRWLVWVEGGEPGDYYYASTHLALLSTAALANGDPAAATPRALTRELDRTVFGPRFSADGASVLFYYEDHGAQPLGAVSLAGGVVEEIAGGERYVAAFDVGADGSVAVLESTAHRPEEISLVEGGELRPLTRENDELLASLKLAPLERFSFPNAEGVSIEGFLYRPPEAASGQRLPALLRIHGGPVSQFTAQWSFERQLLAAHGYLVIAPNPRGSSGRGRDFAHAIWADWGNRDYDDVIAAVDHAVAIGAADPDRLGVFGWSYGGILTNYVITKTTRFKAAISGASEVNYLSNYGHDQYLHIWEGELGLPWKESAKWIELSPFFRLENVTTPTLVLCGQEDWNVPLINSEQLYQALRRMGKTTELVIYPGENHSIDRPSFQQDRFERYLAWFDRHVLGRSAAIEVAAGVEATSLLGAGLVAPAISQSARTALEANLAKAQAELATQPGSIDATIWVGRRLGYLGRYREAIEVFSKALEQHPDDVRLLRHRGHRYLTVRELDRAIADLDRAGNLIRTKQLPDELEPDGAPNELGIPTSTTQFNVWYHLGLAHYLKGDFEAALVAYRSALPPAAGSPAAAALPAAIAAGAQDRLVATTDWLWLTLMRLDRRDEAAAALAAVPSGLEVIEDQTYLDRIRFYKGELTADQLLADADGAVDVATRSYAVGAVALIHGDVESARDRFARTLANARWDSFAVLAAEAELARRDRR